MQDLNDLYYFVQVVDHGGFAPAGRALGVPKSKLSRRVALLEDRLGVRLIQRSTRRFAVTPVGTTYYTHCKAMLVEAQAAQESIDQTRAEPCGIVRISCPPTLLDNLVATMLADFMSAHHRVELHVEATDRVVDLIAEGIDIALRVRRPPLADSDLLLRSLAPAEQCLVASPDLLARSKLVQGPTDLAELTSLAHGESHDEHSWDLVGPQGARATISHRPRLVSRGSARGHRSRAAPNNDAACRTRQWPPTASATELGSTAVDGPCCLRVETRPTPGRAGSARLPGGAV